VPDLFLMHLFAIYLLLQPARKSVRSVAASIPGLSL